MKLVRTNLDRVIACFGGSLIGACLAYILHVGLTYGQAYLLGIFGGVLLLLGTKRIPDNEERECNR